ncbi:hypothetical protein N9018_00945 [Rhodopirellula sp.]|nr:hypothetical protein [Rhodopirellula sp.]
MKRLKATFSARMCLILSLVLGLIPAIAFACKVPVFRYALERWNVDRYTMVVMLNGEPDEEVAGAVKRVMDASATDAANVEVQVIDIAKLSPQEQWQLEDFDATVETPHLQIFYPERNGRRKLCWEGAFTSSVVDAWLSSPLRSKVIDQLVAGASAVFVLVEGEDPKINQQVEEMVRLGVQQAMLEISIPEGVIPRLGANEYLKQHPEASLDDVLRCDIPLKVDFQISRLAFDDQNESALRAMGNGLAASSSGPWLIPVFGRGRMLDAIDAKDLTAQTVMNACQYMVGECSCTVKTQNPGVDLLMSANWSESLGGDTVVIVDSQTQLSPQLVEIPNGVPSASSLMQSDQNTVAENADERPALDDEQAMDDDSGMDDPSAGGLGLRAVLISVLAGTAIAVIGLGLRSRNR